MALLAKWPWRQGQPVIIQRPESRMGWFLEQGWKVIAKDSEILAPLDAPSQSDPHRDPETED